MVASLFSSVGSGFTVQVFSGSTNGRPITVPTGPDELIHTVPAGATDLITMFCSNTNDANDMLVLQWGAGGSDLEFFLPSHETVPIVVDMPLLADETIEANSVTASVFVFGRVLRVI